LIGEIEVPVLEEKPDPVPLCTAPGSNPGLSGERTVIGRLSYGAAGAKPDIRVTCKTLNTSRLIMYGEIIAVYCKNHMEQVNILCGQYAVFSC
jgi:hypothetical protein